VLMSSSFPILHGSPDYPNFSICGLPFYSSGGVSDWRTLAHDERHAASFVVLHGLSQGHMTCHAKLVSVRISKVRAIVVFVILRPRAWRTL
jgi:hypothetical protein